MDDRRSVNGMIPGELTRPRDPAESSVIAFAVGTIAILLVLPPLADAIERHSAGLMLLLAAIVATMVSAVAARSLLPRRWWWAAHACLALLAVAAVIATLQLGPAWRNVWLLLAIGIGSVLCSTSRAVVLVILATVASGIAVSISRTDDDQAWGLMLTVFLAGGSNIVLTRLLSTIRELRMTRAELAQRAVADERERFSRDLHDLLGHTLSVVVVKAEAVRRLVHADPDAAAVHATDIESIGRRALTEIREAVEGYRRTSLAAEIDRGRRALEATGIDVSLQVTPTLLPEPVDEALAWVVREGVTNVIRHAQARRCSLTIELRDGRAHLELIDDGAVRVEAPHAGSGLDGLRHRVSAVGGEITTSRTDDGFRLVADVPVMIAGARS